MQLFQITILLLSLMAFFTGTVLILFGLLNNRNKLLKRKLYNQYAVALYTEMNVHERLDNPIKVAKMIVEKHKEGKPISDDKMKELQTHMENIGDGVGYMKRTLKMLHGQSELKKHTFNLNEFIAHDILGKEEFGSDVKMIDSGIQFKITATRMEIKALVRVVLDNALKHGKPPILIDIRRGEGRRILIELSDEGFSEFDPETLQTIQNLDMILKKDGFSKLQERASNASGDNGVGLIVAHMIAKANGGKVAIKSRGKLYDGVECELNTVVIELSGVWEVR